MHTLSSAHNSFEAWNQALRQVCGRFESQPALNRTLFIGDISRQDLGGVMAAVVQSAGMGVEPGGQPGRQARVRLPRRHCAPLQA